MIHTYQTIQPEDFSIFEHIKGNRKILITPAKSGIHKGEITKRLELYSSLRDFEQVCDVLCCYSTFKSNRVLIVLDGQHRRAACAILGKPLDVKIFSENDGSDLSNENVNQIVKTANNSSKAWNNLQHLVWDSTFNQNPYAIEYLKFRNLYKNLDDNALYCIITKDPLYRAKVQIHSGNLQFDLDPKSLEYLNVYLELIDYSTSKLLKLRKSIGYLGLRKTIINMALHLIFQDSTYDQAKVLELMGNIQFAGLMKFGTIAECVESIKIFYSKV